MNNNDIKVKIFIVVVAIIIIITIGLYIYKTSKDEEYLDYVSIENTNEEDKEQSNQEEEKITVHITGEVKYPGVVVLKSGDRIVDAIEAAGGENEEADLNRLNLAYLLNDGEKIYVPNKNEESDEDIISTIDEDNSSVININTASLEELITLPGIGEATANKIIEYRKQNGKFETIEELKNVPGIGSSKLENLKDKIKVK